MVRKRAFLDMEMMHDETRNKIEMLKVAGGEDLSPIQGRGRDEHIIHSGPVRHPELSHEGNG